MAQFPSKEIAQLSLRVPHARPRLRQSRRPPDVVRHRATTRDAGRAIGGALTAIMTGVSYATSAEMAKELGPFPGYKKNREHMLRVIRNHRRAALRRAAPATRRSRRRRCRSTTPRCQRDPRAGRARQARLGPRARARRGARLPQRAGHGDRADRHHRPGDGLRHHRHRARLRAGEVQEARRRRLLQDHQPRRAGGAARARLLAKRRSPRSRPTRSATARSARRPASTTRTLRPRASRRRRSTRSRRRCRPPSTSSSPSTSGRWARSSAATLGIAGRELADPRFDLLAALGFTKREIEAANVHVCGAMTVEGAPHLKAEHYAVFDCANPCGTHRQALSLGREPHPHDGGGAAVHLGRDLQDHQHAERRHGRGLQGGVPARPGSSRSRPTRSTATARSSRSRCRAS